MIRRYTMRDIPILLDHINVFLSETETFKNIPVDRDKLRLMLANNISNNRFFCDVATDDGGNAIIGGLCAVINEYVFSKLTYASDLIFYVPTNRRSTKVATELVESYVKWSKARKVVECRLANSTGVRPEAYAKLCERFGFSYLGPIYQMRF